MRNFFYCYSRNIIWVYLSILFVFSYMLIVDLIPEHVYVSKGNELRLSHSFPVSIVIQGKEKKAATAEVFQSLDYGEYTAECFLLGVVPLKEIHISVIDEESLYASGKIIGVYGHTKGVLVTKTGSKSSFEPGDYIIEMDGEELFEKEILNKAVLESGGKKMVFKVIRDGEEIQIEETPKQTDDGKYLLGIWVKDDLAGIGTLTYFTTKQFFGALGHGIADGATGEILSMQTGNIYNAKIHGIDMSRTGNPGKIEGSVSYSAANRYGEVSNNSNIGIYGRLDDEDYFEFMKEANLYPVMHKQDVLLTKGAILSQIDGETKEYEIEILSVDYDPSNVNKQIMFRVLDERLIAKTGGIVQGMSGSPILQDGKIVGAVTHVFVSDPTKGYGIFIEEMVK